MLTGTMTADTKTKTFTAALSTLFFDISFKIEPNGYKQADNHPDFIAVFTNAAGRAIRIGSVWTAKSQSTGSTYYSIAITDRNNQTWRMNAVRNDEMAKGDWVLVPLAGGETDRTMVTGKVEALDDGNLAGDVGSFDFDFRFTAIAIAEKAKEDHPDYHIEATSRTGKTIRMGAIWNATSERSGKDYLSMRFWAPDGTQHHANAVRGDETADGQWEIIPLAETKPELVAA